MLLIRMKLGGRFTLDDVRAFDLQRQHAIAKLRCPFNRHLTLCDVRDCELSTPDVVSAIQAVIGNPLFRSRRCALIVSGALKRLQARRAAPHDTVALFDDPTEAEHWLLTPEKCNAA